MLLHTEKCREKTYNSQQGKINEINEKSTDMKREESRNEIKTEKNRRTKHIYRREKTNEEEKETQTEKGERVERWHDKK